MGTEERTDGKEMTERNNNREEEEQTSKDPESNLDRQSHKRLLPFSLEIDSFKNPYLRRSIHSVLCLAFFVAVVLVWLIGIELFFSFFQTAIPAKPKFDIHPKPNEKNLIHLKKDNLDVMVTDIRTYLSRHKSSCESNDHFFCSIRKEIDNSQCSDIRSFGMKYGTPCILVDLKPVVSRLNPNITGDNARVHLKCDGLKNVDKEAIGPVEYYPRNGVPIDYLRMKDNTTSAPFVFVHLVRPTFGVVFNVKCDVFWESQKEMVVSEQNVQFETLIDF